MDNEVTNSEYEVIKRRLVLSRKLKDLAETGKDNARLAELVSNADIELAAAEDACRFSRFSVAAQCLDRAGKVFADIEKIQKRQKEIKNQTGITKIRTSVHITFPFGKNQSAEEKIKKMIIGENGEPDFGILLPMPPEVAKDNDGNFHFNFFNTVGPEWRYENWGCDWNCENAMFDDKDPDLVFTLDTTYKPPLAWLKTLCERIRKQFIDLSIRGIWVPNRFGDTEFGEFICDMYGFRQVDINYDEPLMVTRMWEMDDEDLIAFRGFVTDELSSLYRSEAFGEDPSSNIPSANTYMVIDLSKGPSADTYPVSYLTEPPLGGFNTNEYKTDKIVLRRIAPGAFPYLGKYKAILTKPYYIGLFEVTQRQFERVMGQNPSMHKGATYPVERVFYETIRGQYSGEHWPDSTDVDSDSFIGLLRIRTRLTGLDLPTDAQWDYAFLAGATEDNCDQGELGRLGKTSTLSEQPYTGVGSYPPNPWGIYYTDIDGRGIQEWCLDWYSHFNDLDLRPLPFVDPKGPPQESGGCRVMRCFMYLDPDAFDSYSAFGRSPEVWCYDAYHDGRSSSCDQSHQFGFRLAMHVN